MRYIKTYENLYCYSLIDFTVGSYWRWKHTNIDTTMKIEKVIPGKYTFNNSDYDIKYIDKNSNIVETNLNSDLLEKMINIDDSEKILRPATEEEIIKFDLLLNSGKYNL